MGLFDFLKKNAATQSKIPEDSAYREEQQTLRSSDVMSSGNVSADRIELNASNFEMLQSCFIAFDVETTGLNAFTDRIVEIGAVCFENGLPTRTFGTLVNPGVAIPPAATSVNHITNAMLKSAPDEAWVYPRFLDFLGEAANGKIIMCAYNARFDFTFLSNTLSRLGIDAELRYMDTLSLARRYMPGLSNYQQGTIEDYLGLCNRSAHRAESDAEICGGILCNILVRADETIKEEKRKIDAAAPALEELEVCAYIQKGLTDRRADTSWIRYGKNSSNYVDVTCLYTCLKFKFARKGRYIILPETATKGTNIPVEACTASEGGTEYRRVYFCSPFDLEPFMDCIYEVYTDCYQSMRDYISLRNHGKREAEDFTRMLKALSEKDIEELLASAASRKYSNTTVPIAVEPTITRADVIVNAIHNRCSLQEIKNLGDWDQGFQAGFKYWEKGEAERKEGRLEEAITLYDRARYNGYEAPALYESYALAFRKFKDYNNEIIIIEEFLSRNAYGKEAVFEARRDKAINLLYRKQQAKRAAMEKTAAKAQRALEKEKVASGSKQPKGRSIVQMKDDGTVVQVYNTVTSAANEVGISTKSIRDAAKGVQKHAGGYCWKYKE